MKTISEEVAKATNGVEAELEAPVHKVKMKAKQTDVFILTVQELDKLSAAEAVAEVPTLLGAVDENYFRLGGLLSSIKVNKHYETAGVETFTKFVEAHGMRLRKAEYLLHIYDKLIESGVPWAKVKDVGWTKLRHLAAVLTQANADAWVQTALSSTVLQLQEAIAKAEAEAVTEVGPFPNSSMPPTAGVPPTADTKSSVTAFTVKVHDEQKASIKQAIAKAKSEAQTDYDGVALEGICMNYLAGGNVTKPTSLKAILEKYTPEEVFSHYTPDEALKALETVFPDFIITAKLKSKV